MGNHSSILAWKIPWTEEPGGLQSMGSQRVGHNLATKQHHHPLTTRAWLRWWALKTLNLLSSTSCPVNPPLVSTSSIFIRLLEIDQGCAFSKGICVSLNCYLVSGPFSSREVGGFGTPTSWDWGYQPGREAHLHTPPHLTCTTAKLQKPQTSQGWARAFSGEPDASRVCGQWGWCLTPTWRKVSDDYGHPGGLPGDTHQLEEGPVHPASCRVRI